MSLKIRDKTFSLKFKEGEPLTDAYYIVKKMVYDILSRIFSVHPFTFDNPIFIPFLKSLLPIINVIGHAIAADNILKGKDVVLTPELVLNALLVYKPNVDILISLLKDLGFTCDSFTVTRQSAYIIGQFVDEFNMDADASTFFRALLQNAVKLVIKEMLCGGVVTYEVDLSEITPKELCHKFKFCANCGIDGNPVLQKCSKCNITYYCSILCQKNHWKYHKLCCDK